MERSRESGTPVGGVGDLYAPRAVVAVAVVVALLFHRLTTVAATAGAVVVVGGKRLRTRIFGK